MLPRLINFIKFYLKSIDSNSTLKQENYRIEGEKLREEIIKRVNGLQTIIGTAIEVAKERRDTVSKRVLEQTNTRLQGAKDRADKILREVYICLKFEIFNLKKSIRSHTTAK